jgi:hypothetical protein
MADYRTLYVPIHGFPPADELRSLSPGAEVHWEGERAVVAWPSVRVQLTRMPDREMGRHLSGFVGFARARGGRESLGIRILHTLSVIGGVIEPGFDAEGKAIRLFTGLTAATDGLCFEGAEVRDARGRGLLLGGEGLEPPDAERVARRTLVLLALSMRGLLEQDAGGPDEKKADEVRRDLWAWMERSAEGVAELEGEERALLDAPIGALERQSVVDAVWRAEGAQVLLWALGARPLPAHDAQEHPYAVARDCGILGGALSPALATPRLRSSDEIETLRRQLLGIHWRLRELGQSTKPVDFAAFARKNWFGGFEMGDIALASGDLAIGGKPVTAAEPERLRLAGSSAAERHQAANWLIGVHERYSRVGTPT